MHVACVAVVNAVCVYISVATHTLQFSVHVAVSIVGGSIVRLRGNSPLDSWIYPHESSEGYVRSVHVRGLCMFMYWMYTCRVQNKTINVVGQYLVGH